MSAAALLAQKPRPSDEDIDQFMTAICSMWLLSRIREAIHSAAEAGGQVQHTGEVKP